MKVDAKVIKAWSGKQPGHVFRGMSLGMAKTLERRGFVEILGQKKKRARRKTKKDAEGLQPPPDSRADSGTGDSTGSEEAAGTAGE